MENRATPYDIQSVPRFPETLQIYRIPASSYWQCRYFIDGKYIRKSTKTSDRSEAIIFAKNLFDRVRLADRLDEQKHPHTFAAAARKFLDHQKSRVIVEDLDVRAQVEDQKKLNKDILPFFRTMDVSQITKQTITDYLGSLNDRQLSKSTRNKHIVVIRKVLKHAADAGILKALPRFPTIGIDANPRSWFDRDEYKKLRDTAKKYAKEKYVAHAFVKGKSVRRLVYSDEFYDFIIFSVNVFVRISDIKLLQNKHIKIIKKGDNEGLAIRPPASKTEDRTSISMRSAVAVYRRLLERHQEVGLAGPNDFVFYPEHKNRAYALNIIRRLFDHLLHQTKLKSDANGIARTLYSLRHTALMFRFLYGKDVDIRALAHNALTSVLMLEKFYLAHVKSEMKMKELQSFVWETSQ
jgi:site-specific recombinase XerD